jgi:hypothetical protein
MCLLVIIMCGIFSNDEFKSKPYAYSALSAARTDTPTATPETTPIHQNVRHNPAPSSSSSGHSTLVTEPNPARNVDGSKEYQPQRPPKLESRFQEERLNKDEERNHGPGFWNDFCPSCLYGFGAVLLPCLEIVVHLTR